MRYFKNVKVVFGSALILGGIALILTWFFHVPAREISRPEFEQFLTSKSLFEPLVTPTPYSGIYRVEGRHKANNKLERVYLTTHLDEAQIKSLFDQSGLKVDLPGEGVRGQWVSIFSTVTIGGLIVGLLYFQSNLG